MIAGVCDRIGTRRLSIIKEKLKFRIVDLFYRRLSWSLMAIINGDSERGKRDIIGKLKEG